MEADLGRAVDTNAERRRPTTRGLKIAHSALRRKLAARRHMLARLQNRLRHTPGQVDAAEVGKTRSLLREDRRLVVNALKLAAANAERLVALRFRQYYQAPNDVFSIFRGLLHLPGTVQSTEADRLESVSSGPTRRRSHTPSKPCSVISIRTRPVSSATGRSFTSSSFDPLNSNGDVLDPVPSEL